MKRRFPVLLFIMISSVLAAQEDTLESEAGRSRQIKNKLGMYFFPGCGGFMYTREENRWDLRAGLLFRGQNDDPKTGLPVKITDTVIWFHNDRAENNLSDLRMGFAFSRQRHGFWTSVGIDLILGIHEKFNYYTDYYYWYTMDSLTGITSYYNYYGYKVENPEDAYKWIYNIGYEQLRYLRLGLSPTFEVGSEGKFLYFGVQVAPEFNYETLVDSKLYDPGNYFGESASSKAVADFSVYFIIARRF